MQEQIRKETVHTLSKTTGTDIVSELEEQALLEEYWHCKTCRCTFKFKLFHY